MAIPLEILLWISLGLCTVTLLLSFRIIKRFRKIAKLTHLVYDELAISKTETSSLLDPKQPDAFAAILETQLLQHAEEAQDEPILEAVPDLPDEPNTFSDADLSSHTKVITRAEAHLVKVLEARYKLNEENSPPTGKNS